jgi:hypothetical protein
MVSKAHSWHVEAPNFCHPLLARDSALQVRCDAVPVSYGKLIWLDARLS